MASSKAPKWGRGGLREGRLPAEAPPPCATATPADVAAAAGEAALRHAMVDRQLAEFGQRPPPLACGSNKGEDSYVFPAGN